MILSNSPADRRVSQRVKKVLDKLSIRYSKPWATHNRRSSSSGRYTNRLDTLAPSTPRRPNSPSSILRAVEAVDPSPFQTTHTMEKGQIPRLPREYMPTDKPRRQVDLRRRHQHRRRLRQTRPNQRHHPRPHRPCRWGDPAASNQGRNSARIPLVYRSNTSKDLSLGCIHPHLQTQLAQRQASQIQTYAWFEHAKLGFDHSSRFADFHRLVTPNLFREHLPGMLRRTR